jgi:hypothetical protein
MNDDDRLPVDALGRPLAPRLQPGYYPGYSTLALRDYWDDATRRTVLKRVLELPPIRFFTKEEVPLLQAVVDRVLPQDDRDPARRIPIVPFIDERLHEGKIDGYRYEGMPPDGDAHRLGLKGIDASARAVFGRSFLELAPGEQDAVLESVHHGHPKGGEEIWKQLKIDRYWLLLLGDVCQIYYAHPWAWDEIGFGGPAYPRGYMRLEHGEPEPWEVKEERYVWRAPPSARSHLFSPVLGLADHYAQSGQGGTH